MNFDDALKQHLPRVWFRFKFLKYKYLKRGEPELWLVRHLVERGMTAVDVGASIGIYSAELARYADKVLAFEANPEVAAFARSVVPRNVEVINAALSSASGRAILTMPLSAKGRAVTELATIEKAPAHAGGIVAVDVETRRLDEFALANCAFIKIDVEGHEEAVLEGASSLIAAQRPVVMIELVESFNPGVVTRLAKRYAALSYDCFFFSLDRFRPIAEFDAARDQGEALLAAADRRYVANFFFIPQEKRERIMQRLRA